MSMKCRVQQLENGAVRIMCGPDPESLCQVSGKTCDKRMCKAHRTRAGNNIDYCPDHRAAAAM